MAAMFDLYGLFVEQIFGGLFLSIIGILVLMTIIILMSRTSFITGITLMGFFLLVCGINYNTLTLFLITLGAIYFFIVSLIALVQVMRT